MAKLHPMVSMELDDEDKLDTAMPIAMPEKPDYPFNLRFAITDKEFAKMELETDNLQRGMLIHVHAICRITDVTTTDGQMGKCCRAEVQIEDMCVESEDAENEEEEAAEDKPRRNPLHDY
jgi:hypothetical protein